MRLILARLSDFARLRLLRFAVVGGVGFAIEAGFLTYFAAQPDIGPIKGRAISFPIAVMATWWLNRNLTFQSDNPPMVESLRYFLVQIVGAVSNLAVFVILVSSFRMLEQLPVLPLFLAAIVGLAINFILSSRMVFARHD
ncbi:MAG: GtrA family protein [Gammaproteobacteria bacterium]|nr:GtrA family protein [Gammaproteobacteria bacterium]